MKTAEDEFDTQFKSYENQHAEYVKHTEKVLKEENERIREKEREYEKWEEKLEKLKERENDEIKKNQEGLEKYKKQLSQRQHCNSQGQNTNFGPLGKPVNSLFINNYIANIQSRSLNGTPHHSISYDTRSDSYEPWSTTGCGDV